MLLVILNKNWVQHHFFHNKLSPLNVPLPKVCNISYNDETWQSYTLPKEYTKNINDISIFSQEISNFCHIKKYEYRLHFNTQFLRFLGLLKIKVFWNKCYDVIIYLHDVTNKMLLHKSNYIVYVVMQ